MALVVSFVVSCFMLKRFPSCVCHLSLYFLCFATFVFVDLCHLFPHQSSLPSLFSMCLSSRCASSSLYIGVFRCFLDDFLFFPVPHLLLDFCILLLFIGFICQFGFISLDLFFTCFTIIHKPFCYFFSEWIVWTAPPAPDVVACIVVQSGFLVFPVCKILTEWSGQSWTQQILWPMNRIIWFLISEKTGVSSASCFPGLTTSPDSLQPCCPLVSLQSCCALTGFLLRFPAAGLWFWSPVTSSASRGGSAYAARLHRGSAFVAGLLPILQRGSAFSSLVQSPGCLPDVPCSAPVQPSIFQLLGHLPLSPSSRPPSTQFDFDFFVCFMLKRFFSWSYFTLLSVFPPLCDCWFVSHLFHLFPPHCI